MFKTHRVLLHDLNAQSRAMPTRKVIGLLYRRGQRLMIFPGLKPWLISY